MDSAGVMETEITSLVGKTNDDPIPFPPDNAKTEEPNTVIKEPREPRDPGVNEASKEDVNSGQYKPADVRVRVQGSHCDSVFLRECANRFANLHATSSPVP